VVKKPLINVNISDKAVFTLFVILALLLGGLLVVASNHQTQSHTLSEITGLDSISVPGSLVVDGKMRVRTLDGKDSVGTGVGTLFLQFDTGHNVQIGGPNHNSWLMVKGSTHIFGDLIVEGNIEASTDWTDLPLASGYTPWAGNYQFPQYRKIGDIVYLRGLARTPGNQIPSDGTTVATLPAGFRPISQLIFSQNSNTGETRMDVAANGNIHISFADVHYVSFDGILFSTT
jgi:hypothetical protein|tara:strand:- start:165 stop:857 length:693 start_codon:yes stop_codon:yes gene_type:complete